jgi:hypothetical protein
VRGPDGNGVPALRCASCYQESNADSTGVPGSHNWHLAPLSMAWQDRNDKPLSSAAICRAVTDRRKNHDMDGPALLKHHAEAKLVGWGLGARTRHPGCPADPASTFARGVFRSDAPLGRSGRALSRLEGEIGHGHV